MIPFLLALTLIGTTTNAPSRTTNCYAATTAPAVVETWTATASGQASAWVCGDYDVALFINGPTWGVDALACCDDVPDTRPSGPVPPTPTNCERAAWVTWPVVAGTTYQLLVTGFRGASGAYTLSLTVPEGPDPDPCTAGPSFPATFDAGVVCATARQTVPCGCSECWSWPPLADAYGYEVTREAVDGRSLRCVADTDSRRIEAYDDESGHHEAFVPTWWCAAWNPCPMVEPGVVYRNTVRAYERNLDGSRVYSREASNVVVYAGAPYLCFEDGKRAECR